MSNSVNDFDEFNRALDNLMIDGEMNQAMATMSAGEDFRDGTTPHESVGRGGLVVQVTMVNGALPIEGAKVTISNTDGSVIAELQTNKSGRTDLVSLETPASGYSQQPGTVLPYSEYNISVEHPEFYTAQFFNVPVFDKTNSIQPVSLEPLGENATENDRIVTNERQSGDGLND